MRTEGRSQPSTPEPLCTRWQEIESRTTFATRFSTDIKSMCAPAPACRARQAGPRRGKRRRPSEPAAALSRCKVEAAAPADGEAPDGGASAREPLLRATVIFQNTLSILWHGSLDSSAPSAWLDEALLQRCFPEGGGAAALRAALAEGRTIRARFQAAPTAGSHESVRRSQALADGARADDLPHVWHSVEFVPGEGLHEPGKP